MSTSTFALTDVQNDFRATLRAFAEEKIAPNAAEADRTAEFPWKSFEACKDMELPALGLPAVALCFVLAHVAQTRAAKVAAQA